MKTADKTMATSHPAKARRADFEAGRLRFLDAADQVYMEHGYAGATIRAISDQAGTSLARLNRHWSGKRHLFEDVFGRHFDAIHAMQAKGLDQVEQSGIAGGELVGAVVQVFFAPAYAAFGQAEEPARRVYCRAMVDTAPEARAIVEALVSPMRDRLVALLRRALPALGEQDLFMVLSAISGAYVYPQLFGQGLADSMGLDFAALDWGAGAAQLGALFQKGVG
ncbi:MAG: TetR family transcriptional regulator [Novosphingobium sp.]|nr:TetR family transcriptional regulator [Novosphingobium sp.]